ncbi:MAG TPA: YCF48-related protein [Methylibium sp.]|uniref:WD40/YVTN/BNR-like repeat-containing protein n=1 Tax=Methylibium sp. TaxID=2067992 RepID=UPI002DBD8C24|nr:YCF48-related protein [Methylibium sp.]HEU4460052.1 YCF48-related protein [Methylibium sp.]
MAVRLLAAALALAAAPLIAAPVTDALQRPALQLRQPERAVLLAAARAGERLVAVGERGVVLLSDDQGKAWRQAPCPVSVTLTALRFADARRGVAVGHGGTVLTTEDAGETWTRRLDGRRLAQMALDAARAGGDAARIKEAELLLQDGPDKPLLDVLLLDAKRIVVVGAYGIAAASDDGGERWTPWMARLDNPRGLHLYALRRHGETLLVAGEQGLLLHSADGGASFKRIALPYKGSFFTAELLSAADWLVAGLRGNAWRSTDAGASWQQLAVPMPASITASMLDRDAGLWLGNQAGFVMRLGAAGFAPVNPTPLAPIAGLAAGAQGLLALGLAGVQPVPVAQAKDAPR